MPKKLLLAVLLLISTQYAQGQTYQESARDLGVFHAYRAGDAGGGVSFADFNQDGWDDLTLATSAGDQIQFYENKGGYFELITPSLVQDSSQVKQVLWVDFDNDGDQDFYFTGFYQNRLFRNDGNLQLTDITGSAGLPLDTLTTFGASWADYDRDGWLDLYITDRRVGSDFNNGFNRMFKNQGGISFIETTLVAGVADSSKAPFCGSFLDIDLDGWEDIYLAQDKTQGNTLLKNLGNGTFEDISYLSGTNLVMNAMCVAVGDYDNDGFFDIYVSNTPEGNALLRNNGDDTFSEVAQQSGVAFYGIGWGSNFFDYDNDGDLDLYVCGMNGPNAFYLNDGNGSFSQPSIGFGQEIVSSFGNAIGDLNNDGYPDILANNSPDSSQLWINGGNTNNWLKVGLEGTYGNRDGIGARLEVYTNGKLQLKSTHSAIGYLGQNSYYQLVGLGSDMVVDSLFVVWPSGIIDRLEAIAANQHITIIEGSQPTGVFGIEELRSCNRDTVYLGAGLYDDSFDYLWSTQDTVSLISVIEPGEFWVEIHTGDSVFYDTLNVSGIQQPFSIDLGKLDVTCWDGTDGQIMVTAEGETGPFGFAWSDGSGDSLRTSLQAGDYTVIVTDNRDCRGYAMATIFQPSPLIFEMIQDPFLNTSATIEVSGGIPPYNYLWDDLQTSPTATGLAPGEHLVVVTDANGCSDSITVMINIISGLENPRMELNVKVYPNPTNSFLQVELDGLGREEIFWQLLDLAARSWMKGINTPDNGSISIDLKAIPDGVYLLQVRSGDFHTSFKVIVTRH